MLADQREMLRKWKKEPLEEVPQVFIPYKEVLDIYNHGLDVPEDVTLMWCDDNYGYIRHFPTPEERQRKGGNGVYYHVSYWGRPHDYLWLATTHPALIYNQMRTAYDTGIQKMWILNVGDIKPAEYLTELFLDMAWDIDRINSQGVNTHLKNWFSQIFGSTLAQGLTAIMQQYYRLAYIRKPEFMGNTRVEERDPVYKIIRDLDWTEKEINERLNQYNEISHLLKTLSIRIPSQHKDCWFQLAEYPVLAANEMNKKILYAQLARHKKADLSLSLQAFDSIQALTTTYNQLKDGKWNRMMDYQPRKLAVFQSVDEAIIAPLVLDQKPFFKFNGTGYQSFTGNVIQADGIGYQEEAARLDKHSSITYAFDMDNRESIQVEIRLVPNHPVEGDQLRISVGTEKLPEGIPVSYETKGRSEEWKLNVLRNQAIRRIILPINKSSSKHSLTIRALDKGVIIDQVLIE